MSNSTNNINWQKQQKEIAANLLKFYQRPAAKVSLELMLSVILVIFLVFAVIQPTMTTMTRLTKEINERQEVNDQLPKKIAALSTAQAEYLQVSKKLPLLDEAIPETVDIIKYLKIIEYEASQNNLVIMNMAINQQPTNQGGSPNANKQNEKVININLSVAGGYADVKSFIKALENSRATFLINSVAFNVKKKHKENILSANINLAIPYYQAKTR